jgi:hypothetical protein
MKRMYTSTYNVVTNVILYSFFFDTFRNGFVYI